MVSGFRRSWSSGDRWFQDLGRSWSSGGRWFHDFGDLGVPEIGGFRTLEIFEFRRQMVSSINVQDFRL